jgi:hypothetical protein
LHLGQAPLELKLNSDASVLVAARQNNGAVYKPSSATTRPARLELILKDLLEAGIIDRAEYNDRMAEIQTLMR